MGYIYGLYNTETNTIFYIGKTKLPISQRRAYHNYQLQSKNAQPVHIYIKNNNIPFEIKIIEECYDDVLTQRERFWISYYGDVLKNSSILCAPEIICEKCNKLTKIKIPKTICYDCIKTNVLEYPTQQYNNIIAHENIEHFIYRKKRSESSIYQYQLEFNKINFMELNSQNDICDLILSDKIWKSISMKKKVTLMIIHYFKFLNIQYDYISLLYSTLIHS